MGNSVLKCKHQMEEGSNNPEQQLLPLITEQPSLTAACNTLNNHQVTGAQDQLQLGFPNLSLSISEHLGVTSHCHG